MVKFCSSIHNTTWLTHGFRSRMCSPINWPNCDTSNWFSLLILKFYWSNFKLQLGGHGHRLTPMWLHVPLWSKVRMQICNSCSAHSTVTAVEYCLCLAGEKGLTSRSWNDQDIDDDIIFTIAVHQYINWNLYCGNIYIPMS